MPHPVLKPRRAPTRLVLTRLFLPLIAAVAVTGVSACGNNGSSTDNAAGAATQADTQGTTQTQTTSPEDALKDTSTKPVIPKPTGSPPRRLVTEDIVKGKGPAAKAGDTVTVNYVGMNFSNGQEFDSSWDSGGAFPVQLGAGMVVKGWDKGLVGIRKGGRRMLTIPPELGYGAAGYPPDIPPNETLVLVVDAVSVK
jgi:peptidylprolyl isomerase